MMFLRLKPRRVEAVKSGYSSIGREEDDEEGRQSLLDMDAASIAGTKGIINSQPKGVPATYATAADSIAPGTTMAPTTAPATEIVVLRVAIHCQGCARRLKKVLLKVEGVNSFHIDVDQQKVTVVGKASPALVLTRVTKLFKNTEFWPSTPPYNNSKPQ